MAFSMKPVLLAAVLGLAAPATALAGDWEGAYVGAYGAYTDGADFGVGALAGYNFGVGSGVYLGPEFDLLYIPSSGVWVGSASARLGYALTPDLLVYGALGVARNSGAVNAWLAGGGFEYMATDSVSLRLGVERYQVFGGGAVDWVGKAGVVWHF